MSTQSPPTLLELAIECLLRDKALTTEAIEHLPGELFPPVFLEAFSRGHTEVLKAMVQSWPFPSLPLGALMSLRKRGTLDNQQDVVQAQKRLLQAVLDGLHVLLCQEMCPRRLTLQVLDMRVVHQNFWKVWAESKVEDCASEPVKWRKSEKTEPVIPNKKVLRIILELWISDEYLCPVASTILQWVKERGTLVQLACPKLCVTATCFQYIEDVLEILDLDSVQQVVVGHCWTLLTLAQFAPFLGQVKNLHKLILCDISEPDSMSPEERQQLVTKITSQLLKLHCLQEVLMDTVDFLDGHLDQVLRCLKTPLETLSVTHCQLSFSDWNVLPCLDQITQLKHLDLSCTRLTSFSPEPLQHLLSNISATLTTLHLENCGITDAQVCAFLPSLSCCSQLTTFCFLRNFISIATMKNLLCHTAKLSNLNLEMYSVPREICVFRHGAHCKLNLQLYTVPQEAYVFKHGIHPRIWMDIHEALMGIMKPLNHPRKVWFCIFNCEFCCNWKLHKMHPNPCLGCIPL